MKLRMLVPALVVGLAAVLPPDAAAFVYQTPRPARLIAFTNEPYEPEFGTVFPLSLRVRFAPGIVAFVPDTLLPAHDAVSAGPGTWTASPGPADSIDIEATYPVMGLMNGGVELPMLEIFSRPAEPGETPGPRPASELDETPNARDDMRRTLLQIGGVMISITKELQGQEASVDPHPPADVMGGDWSPWLVGAVAVGALGLLAIAGIFVAGRLSLRAGSGAVLESPRAAALRELDRVLALGWHRGEREAGRIDEFYDATTGVLRRLSEQEEPEWRRALTSTELMGRIEGQRGDQSVEKLRPAIWSAERVKFGEHRPGSKAAEDDWTVVRDWIRDLPED